MSNFYEDDAGIEYYQSRSGRIYALSTHPYTGVQQMDALPKDAEFLLMTNGGIYPIIARRIEKMEAKEANA